MDAPLGFLIRLLPDLELRAPSLWLPRRAPRVLQLLARAACQAPEHPLQPQGSHAAKHRGLQLQ